MEKQAKESCEPCGPLWSISLGVVVHVALGFKLPCGPPLDRASERPVSISLSVYCRSFVSVCPVGGGGVIAAGDFFSAVLLYRGIFCPPPWPWPCMQWCLDHGEFIMSQV